MGIRDNERDRREGKGEDHGDMTNKMQEEKMSTVKKNLSNIPQYSIIS